MIVKEEGGRKGERSGKRKEEKLRDGVGGKFAKEKKYGRRKE